MFFSYEENDKLWCNLIVLRFLGRLADQFNEKYFKSLFFLGLHEY